MPSPTASSGGYGAVEGSKASTGADEPATVDRSFDASETYYLTGASGRPLTAREKWRKCMLVAVPLLAAAVIVGGAALFLLRDFNNLYPGRGGGSSESARTKIEHPGSTGTTTSVTSNNKSSVAGGDSAASKITGGVACANHVKCRDAGLLGDCCPTPEGIQLDCCN